MAVKRVVVFAVIELLADAPANLEMEIGSYRHIARVKKTVNVASQQQTVARFVCAALTVGSDSAVRSSR